jgi:uncharacterized protein
VNSRRPLLVPVTQLLRQPGTRRPLQREVPLDGLAVAGVEVDADTGVGIDLVLEAIGDDVVAAGTLSIPWISECRRCLTPVSGRTEADLREVFQPRPVEGETYALGEGTVDLEPMLRDAVLLALPLAPLCAEDCAGPAPDRFPAVAGNHGGPDSDADPSSPAEPPRDPRWAVLDELRFDAGGDGG